jgi:hypothetical protein
MKKNKRNFIFQGTGCSWVTSLLDLMLALYHYWTIPINIVKVSFEWSSQLKTMKQNIYLERKICKQGKIASGYTPKYFHCSGVNCLCVLTGSVSTVNFLWVCCKQHNFASIGKKHA